MGTYWNHNTAYHSWVRRIATEHPGDILDVGCGDGLLLQRLTDVATTLTGVDTHGPSIEAARRRLASTPHAQVLESDFLDLDMEPESYDVVTFVASVHHMHLATALRKASTVLRPGGSLAVVGLAKSATLGDFAWGALTAPAVWIGDRIHGLASDIGAPLADSDHTLANVRAVAMQDLPGAKIRRALYWRYLLHWVKPS